MRAALDHPERYAALILESAHPGIESVTERAERRGRDAELASWIRRDYAGFLDAWNRLPLFASPTDAPAGPNDAFRRIQRSREPEALARCLETFGAGDVEPVRHRLGELRMPVLAVTGERDLTYTALWTDITREHPHIRHAVVPDAGHRVHLDRPEAYLSILTSFIQDVFPS
jgi:2-succinyl-6-hydroxy-2,4-cyclohexadiene-1-carboxylate synthase